MSLQIKKHKDRIRCKDYLSWLHESQVCLRCHSLPIEAHHSVPRSRAAGSDLLCVPLCRTCHGAVLSSENFTFEIMQLQEAYMRDRGISLNGNTLEGYLLALGLAEQNDGSKRPNRKPFKKKFEAYF